MTDFGYKHKTWHEKHSDNRKLSEALADIVARAIGSTASVIFHTVVFIACFALVITGFVQMGTMLLALTTIVSLEAIYIGIFLQMSSNRSGDRDRVQAEDDYRTNREAKQEIEMLQKALYKLETKKLDKLLSYFATHKIPVIDLEAISRKPEGAKRSTKKRVRTATVRLTTVSKRQGR